MPISSNTLFHFYKEKEFLKQALKEGLWPRYCVERKWNGKDFAIPMFCFCDIPLSQIKDHINEERGYGNYGIGVTKDFARVNKITPVIYLSQGSFFMNKILYFISNKLQEPATNLKKINFEELMLYYIKKVGGYNSFSEHKRKFYDEREWRYIPQISQDVHIELLTGKYDKQKITQEYSERTKSCKLQLKPEDISYLIVKNESDITDIIKTLQQKYENHRLLEHLYSRIITIKQILKDF